MQRTHLAILLSAGAVAGLQAVLASTTALSRWKGGGFGMYTDPHPYQSRVVWLVPRNDGAALHEALRLYPPAPALVELLDRTGSTSPAEIARELALEADRFRTFPRDRGAHLLLDRIDQLSTSAGRWRIRVTEIAIAETGDALRVQPIYDGPGDHDR